MKTVSWLFLVLCGAACTPSAFISSPVPAPIPVAMVGSWHPDGSHTKPSGFYDPETLEFDESASPGQFITLTADGHFEEGRVTHSGSGACAVTRYEYHAGTVAVHDTSLVLYATAGRVRNVAPCDLTADYEKNDVGVRTMPWHPAAALAVR